MKFLFMAIVCTLSLSVYAQSRDINLTVLNEDRLDSRVEILCLDDECEILKLAQFLDTKLISEKITSKKVLIDKSSQKLERSWKNDMFQCEGECPKLYGKIKDQYREKKYVRATGNAVVAAVVTTAVVVHAPILPALYLGNTHRPMKHEKKVSKSILEGLENNETQILVSDKRFEALVDSYLK